MNKEQFDEMQTQRRNMIGNQSFSLLVILLMIDTFLYNLGVKWLEYPTNVFLLVVICCGVFVIRSAFHDSLIGPKQKPWKTAAVILFSTILGIGAVTAIVLIAKPTKTVSENSDIGSVLLFSISWGILITAGVICFVRRIRENNSNK